MKNNNNFFVGEVDLGDSNDTLSIICIPKNPICDEMVTIQYNHYIETIKKDGRDIIITDHYTYNCLETEDRAFSCLREENQSTVSSKPEVDKNVFIMLYEYLNNRDFNFKVAQVGIQNQKKQIDNEEAKKLVFPVFEEIILTQENNLDNMLLNVCSDLNYKTH